MTTPRPFPEPDSSAERILDAIKADPGVTTNGLIRRTGINPGPIRTYLQRLLDRGLIEDRMDEREYHHYHAKGDGESQPSPGDEAEDRARFEVEHETA